MPQTPVQGAGSTCIVQTGKSQKVPGRSFKLTVLSLLPRRLGFSEMFKFWGSTLIPNETQKMVINSLEPFVPWPLIRAI